MSNPFAKYLEAVQRQDALFGTKLSRQSASVYDDYTPPEDTIKPTKTLDNYIGDTAVDATKAAMTLAQTGISALDLGAYSLGGLGSSALEIAHAIAPETVDKPVWNEYGLVSKALNDNLGFNIGKAKQTLGELGYSDIRKAQDQELYTGYTKEQIDAFNNEWANQYNLQYQDLANKGANALQLEGFKAKFNDNYKKAYTDFIGKNQTSMDKSLGENLDAIGTAFNKVLDNPSLGVGAAIESTGYLAPSLLVSRGVAALQGASKASAASQAVAAGTGEGLVSALALNEQMRGNSETGTIDGNKVAAGLAGGALTGLIGGASNRLGSKLGLDDVDSLGLGTQAKGFSVTRPLLATGQEAGEEFVQGIGETVIPNIAEGNDPLQGLAQELALGTVAGGIMGGATNARSLVSGAGSDLIAGFNKVAEAVGKGKDAITAKTFEEFNDPTNKGYDPAKAFNSQVPDLSSTDDLVRAKAQENIDSVFTNLDNHLEKLQQEKRASELVLKNYEALSLEDKKTPKFIKEKQDAEKDIKDLEERITIAGNQYGDLYLQKIALEKNQEVQAGIPQYSEEQAKADIEILSQAPASTAVWATEDNDGNALNIPVTITGTPVVSNGYETVEVKYTDSIGKERTTYAPTSALVQDATTQQEAVQRITKHFSKLSLDELATVAKSPYLSEEQRNSLRYLSEAKRAIADLASPTDVTKHIMNGLKGKTPMESHRGLNNYTDMVNTAINTKDEKLLNLALNDLGRFAQDHTDKANALVEANQLVTSGQFPKVQVLRSNDGTWGIVTDPNKFVDDIKLKATAGWNVTTNSNKNGRIDLVTKEATLIQDNLKALTQVGLSFGLQAVEPTVTPPVSVETLREANKPSSANKDTASINSAITRLNNYNKSGTPLTVDSVTPEALQTLQAKVSSAFELGAVNQQTHDGVTKDIATLQQYLTGSNLSTNQDTNVPTITSQTEPIVTVATPSQEVSTPNVIKAWKGVGKSVSKAASSDLGFFATTDKEYASQYAKTGIPEEVEVILSNPYQMGFKEFREIDRGISIKSAKEIAQDLKAKGHDGIIVTHQDGVQELITFSNNQIVFVKNKDLNSSQNKAAPSKPATPPQTEPTAAVNTEPTKDTTQDVEAPITQDNSPVVNSVQQQSTVPDSNPVEATVTPSDSTNKQDSENVPVVSEQTDQTSEGTITVLQGVTKEVRQEERSKLMSLRNMVVAYFTQSSVKEEGKGTNPLVAVKDYILQSNLLTQVSNWLSTGYKVSNAQLKQLQHFKEFHKEFRGHILFSLQNREKLRGDNNSDNFVEYLITKDVSSLKDTLDENTLTAISLAAYSYLLQYGTKVTNTDEDIIKLLRLEKDTPIPDVTSNLLRNAGQDAYSVAKELGSSISSSLGLKAMKDASTSMQDRLNTSFGLLTLAALHNSKYMYVSRLSKNDINAITQDLNLSLDPNDFFNPQDSSFVGLNQLTTISANYKINPKTNKIAYKDGKAVLVREKDLEELLTTNKNTKGFLSQLFGVSVGFRLPSIFTPEKFTQKTIPNTNASIPSNQRKQVEAAQKNSNVMRVNTINVFKSLFGLSEDSKYLKELLGIWVDDNVLAQTHISKHESLKAKAENEWRLVNQGLEWAGYIELGNNEYAEFYDTQSVVQNNRMHIDSNLFNQQSSQIHRAMAAKSAFAVTFNVFENQELLTRFYQGVAEGLEKIEKSIKQDILARNPQYNFFTVDKVPAEDFVPAFEKFLTTSESIAAIDAMIALIQTKTVNAEQQAAIAWFVNKGGMGVQSLQSLIFLAELGIAAQADGMLTTTVSYGSDGINNGVSNANMLLGTASETMRTQTGIISKNSTANNIQDVYAQGISDYYVDFGSYMRDFLDFAINKAFEKISEIGDKGKRANKTNKVNALLDLFTTFQVEVEDALGMRKISKVWSIPFNYGAGKVALQRALANGFMKGIYDEMERINNSIIGKPRNSLEYATAIQDRNTLEARLNAVLTDYTFVNNKLIAFKPIKLPLPESLNTFTFQDSVIQNVGTKNDKGDMIFRDITLIGTDATYAIEIVLKTAMTQLHGKAAWKATEAFSKDYMNMYSLYLKAQSTSFELYNFIHSKLVQLKLDAKVRTNKVEGEYTGLTTEELQEIDNIIGNFKPVVNTPISSKATNATQSGIPLADKDKKLEKATPNRVVSSRYPIKGFEGNEKPNMKPALVSNQLTDKGTAGMALPIQGMDALVASAVQAKYPILNIHDQASMPIDLADEIIQYQNEVHLEGLITYHLGLENAKTLVNTFRGVLAFINNDSKVLEDEKANAELLASLATEFKEKLQPKLAEGEVVQNVKTGEESYSYKGLSLKYPDMALGESTTDLRDAIKTFVITAISNDIKKLNALLETKAIHQYGGEGGALPLTKKHREHIKEQLEYLQRQRVALVEAINSPITKDFTVVAEYQSPLITALESNKGKPITKTNVLDLLTKTTHHKDTDVLNQEQEVLKAIKDLIPDDLTLVYEEDTYEGQGYYNTETKRIHIKAITSEGSYVDTHLLVHELLHSAVAARLQAIKNNPNKYDEARAAVTQLENIRQEVLNLLSIDGLIFTELHEKLNADSVDLAALNNETVVRLQAINKEEESLHKQQKEMSARWESSNAKEKAVIREQQAQLKQSIDSLNKEREAKTQTLKDIDTYKKAKNNLRAITIEGFGSALSLAYKLKNLDEFIAYGLSNQKLQAYLKGVQLQQNKRSVPNPTSKWRRFVEAVTKLVGFRGKNASNALTAFAVTTAELFEQLKGVTPANTNQTLKSEYGASDQVNQMSSIEVMQSLPHTGNTDFGLHLNRLAESVIGQLYNNDEVAKAQIDVIQAIQVAPAIKAGFNLSQREAAVQRSLELVLETYTLNTAGGANASQLWKIYKESQKNIKAENLYDGDWSTATAQERAATHQKFKYLFADNLKGTEALARFVSMALASEEVHNLLGFNTVTAKPSKQKSWFDTVSAWAQYVFAWVGNKLVRTSANDPAYKQLQSLVNNLVVLDIRNRQDTVALYEKAWNLVGKITEPLDKAAQSLRQYATNRDFLRNSKYLSLRTLGSIAALDAKAMGETIPKLIRETRDKARPNEKLGEAMNALMESTAMTQIRKAMEALIRQANLNAKERQDRTDNVKKAIMSWFKDGGKHITKEQHKAITYTLLRTDAQSLLTTFGLNKTIGLLLDINKLKNEIDLVTKDISQYQNGNSMINQAMRLAYYMVTNKGGLGLSKNPTAIAMGLGTNYQVDLKDVDQALVGQLDVLVSLFAMKYTSAKDRKVLGDMYAENPEALEGLLQMHKGFMTDAATEFKDNPLSYTKGWMPEIVNPYREVKVANVTQKEQMLKEGWKLIEEIKPQGSFLMVHPDIGYQRLVSGAVDLQNSHRKGTEIVNRTSRNYLDTVRANLAYTAHIASIPHTQFDPSKQETGLIPAYDTDGVPMGFNYEMASWVRDKEMERNNNFADLMGAYAGAMFYKPAKRNQSVTVANVLFEDYKQNYQKNPNSYIKLSGKSSDPKIVEMWRMLPKDFRQRATELYGKGEPIIINNEAFLLAFGFKKWTITSIWDKPADQRTDMETMFITMAEKLLGDTAKARISKAGHIWTEAVSKAKDFIVIRSIGVLWNNVLANGLMLMANGINPINIAKEWTFITANVRSYQKLHSELLQLKANTLAGKGNDALERQINAIQKQLESNPMNKYINEGLLSSIVEDVTIQQGDYSYDSELKKKIDGVTGWLPDSVKTIGAWAVLNPSTQGYQFLATTTQLSDFVAKVTLAKHLESKGMDFKAAVSEASQTFINYDVPQGVGMQYMNDMGLFMFTKFFLRIQAVLFKLMDKKAATVLAQHIAVEGLTDMQGILDPMALARVGNWPFEEGAFSIVGAAMSIAPVNVVF